MSLVSKPLWCNSIIWKIVFRNCWTSADHAAWWLLWQWLITLDHSKPHSSWFWGFLRLEIKLIVTGVMEWVEFSLFGFDQTSILFLIISRFLDSQFLTDKGVFCVLLEHWTSISSKRSWPKQRFWCKRLLDYEKQQPRDGAWASLGWKMKLGQVSLDKLKLEPELDRKLPIRYLADTAT